MKLTKRQEEIIEVSVKLIADRGMRFLTIKNISEEIGISEPAIYRHFKNKYEILMTILDSFEEIAGDVLDSDEIRDLTPLEKIEFFLMDRYKRCAKNAKLAKVMFSEENFQDDKDLSAKALHIMHSHKVSIEAVLKEAEKTGSIRNDIDLSSLFRIIFGSMRLLVKQWCLSGFKFDLEPEGRKLWNSTRKLIVNKNN